MDNTDAMYRRITAEIKAGMKAAGLSQRDLAEVTGIPLVTLSRRLSQQGKGFTVAEVLSVADALGTSLVELAIRAERAALTSAA